MILAHTRLVTPERGPRPAGKPTECFYCHKLVGDAHADDCVLFEKIVMVKVEMVIPRAVPAHWTDEQIELQMNDGSWCANNIARDIERMDEADEEDHRCLCNDFQAEVLRDATVDDLNGYTLTKFTDGR